MRHLGRDSAHRRALFRNLASALIKDESIVTTVAKAKEAQKFVEKLITRTKDGTKEQRILATADLFDTAITVPKLFGELASRYRKREGGYTRIIRLEPRLGDNAPQAVLELVDSNYDIKFWYTARIVARLELQNEPMNYYTKSNVQKIVQFRKGGYEKFREAVEECKEVFYKNDQSLDINRPKTRPSDLVPRSKVFKFTPRPAK